MMAHCTSLLAALATLLPQGAGTPPNPQDPAPRQGQAAPAAPTGDPLIATVADREIRLSDLIEEVNRQIPLNYYHRRVPPGKMAEFQREAFDNIVVKHLIHLDALATGLEVSEAEVRATFDDALREAGSQYAQLDPKAKDALYAEVRPAVLRRALIQKNEARLADQTPKVDEKMVREIYEERVAADETAFMAPKEAHFHHIYVAVDPSLIRAEEAEKQAKIEKAQAELRAGKPFAEVARAYSEDEFAAKGGDIGYQKAGSFRMKTLNEHAFTMAKGQTSDIIRSLHGFHLLFCADVKPAHRYSFEEMRPAIEKWLQEEHHKIARGKWLAGLRGKYPVELLRPDLLEAQDEAPAEGGKEPTPAPTGAGAEGPGRH